MAKKICFLFVCYIYKAVVKTTSFVFKLDKWLHECECWHRNYLWEESMSWLIKLATKADFHSESNRNMGSDRIEIKWNARMGFRYLIFFPVWTCDPQPDDKELKHFQLSFLSSGANNTKGKNVQSDPIRCIFPEWKTALISRNKMLFKSVYRGH
jgi:hypothetical protein